MAAPSIKPSHKGLFHEHMGVKAGEPISAATVMKGLHSKSGKVRSEANFARMAKRHWKPLKKAA